MPLKETTGKEVPAISLDPIDTKTLEQAEEILNDVKNNGLEGFIKHAVRLGDLKSSDDKFIYTTNELEQICKEISEEDRALLQRTKDRIEAFATAQRDSVKEFEIKVCQGGGVAGQKLSPVNAAGCYAPGGRYPLPSSVLMTVVTAKVAGVSTVVVASPNPTKITLAAAYIARADLFLAVGGPQAIGAFAYGLESTKKQKLETVNGDGSNGAANTTLVPQCQCIVGPGNKWVTAAKKLVSGVDCCIDMLAGPSECLVLADYDPKDAEKYKIIAADLIAQAEHDTDALPILVTPSTELISKVNAELDAQLLSLPEPNKATATTAVSKGLAVLCETMNEAVEVSCKLAPEHFELMVDATKEAEIWAQIEANKTGGGYGGLFVGTLSAEVFGDYGVGPNHVLPTSGTAKYTGGLSVFNFLRIRTWMKITPPTDQEAKEKVKQIVKDAAQLARLEGLEGHARAAEKRYQLL